MSAATIPISVIGAFDKTAESWAFYTERLEQLLLANSVTDNNKKHASLLAACGPEIYQLMRDLLSPVKLTDRSYADNSHFSEKAPGTYPLLDRQTILFLLVLSTLRRVDQRLHRSPPETSEALPVWRFSRRHAQR